MTIKEIAQKLNLEVLTGETGVSNIVKGGYTSDLLSDVMGNSVEGQIWITMQSHMNVIAVSTLKEHAGIIVVGGNRPDDLVVNRAIEESVPVLCTKESAFTISGRIYGLLIE